MEDLLLEDDTVIRRCAECSSIWMDSVDLTRLLMHNDLAGLDAIGGRENLEECAGTCPDDLTDLVVVESGKGNASSYAMCEVCGGLWLTDGPNGAPIQGETAKDILADVLSFFSTFAAPRRAGA